MKGPRSIILVFICLVTGCSTLPENPIPLASDAMIPTAGRIGIVMSKIPTVDTFLPGASCLLCLAVAAGANSELTDYARTLEPEGVKELKQRLEKILTENGVAAVIIDDQLDLKKLPNFKNTKEPDAAKTDFRGLKEKYGIERLVVFDVRGLGFKRTYAAYVATSDPKGWFGGIGYMLDLSTNKYKWYLPVDIEKSTEGNWDEPPNFPGLTNAYFQALEHGKDALIEPFLHLPAAPIDSAKSTGIE